MARTRKLELKSWAPSELHALRDRIELELERRDEQAEREAATERARTLVSSREVRELVKCGKPGCRCASGDLHGPYWYRFDTYGNGRVRKRYIGKTRGGLRRAARTDTFRAVEPKRKPKTVEEILAAAPPDDEPLTEADLKAIREDEQARRRGERGIPLEVIKRELGIP